MIKFKDYYNRSIYEDRLNKDDDRKLGHDIDDLNYWMKKNGTRDEDGNTQIHTAIIRHYDNNLLNKIIKSNINLINKKNLRGYTPLSIAVGYGNIDAIKLLLNSGADKYIKDSYNHTPYDIALGSKSSNKQEMIELLKQVIMSKKKLKDLCIGDKIHTGDDKFNKITAIEHNRYETSIYTAPNNTLYFTFNYDEGDDYIDVITEDDEYMSYDRTIKELQKLIDGIK